VTAGSSARNASLTIVGTGIRPGLQTTQEARTAIQRADKVLYLLAEEAPSIWIEQLNPSAESLAPLYSAGQGYAEVYDAIVNHIMSWVRRGHAVCVATYGHPGVLDRSSHEAVERARREGFPATMLPGVSAADCLFADLGLDPGGAGLQSFEATDFLVSGRVPDRSVPLILWQVGVIGVTYTTGEVNSPGLRVLGERLGQLYGGEHEVVLYEASPFPIGSPVIQRLPASALADGAVTGMSTMYVPPLTPFA
jgi:Tetrapyrrole (Corrin/Porphyrin) Methylases